MNVAVGTNASICGQIPAKTRDRIIRFKHFSPLHRSLKRHLILTLSWGLLMASGASPLIAQQLTPEQDSLSRLGAEHGRLAAEEASTVHEVAMGVLSGGSTPLILFGVNEPGLFLAGSLGIGTYLMISTSGQRRSIPERVVDGISGRSPEYREAFREAYRGRLTRRIGIHTTIGFAAGALAGFRLLYCLLPDT